MTRRKSLWPVAVLFALVGLTAGCAPVQPRPLYTSLQASGTYGYYEQQLSDRRYRVSYDAPIERRYQASRADRRREVDRKVALAYEMALLRAAELARMQGLERFRVGERENNVRIEEREEFRGSPFYHPYWHPYWHGRHFAVPYYAYPEFIDRITEIAVSVSFVAELGARAEEDGTFDAGAVIGRLSQKYAVPVHSDGGSAVVPTPRVP